MSQKKDLKEIKQIIEKEVDIKEKISIFLVTLITSMIVHFQIYALMITGPDTFFKKSLLALY